MWRCVVAASPDELTLWAVAAPHHSHSDSCFSAQLGSTQLGSAELSSLDVHFSDHIWSRSRVALLWDFLLQVFPLIIYLFCSSRRRSRARLAAGWGSVHLWPASETPAGKPRSTRPPRPPPPRPRGTETCGERGAEGRASCWGGGPGMIPGERLRLLEELPGLRQIPPLSAALPTPEEKRGTLRRRRPPPPPPLPRLHPLPPLWHTPGLSWRCPPCRRSGRVRSPMSLYKSDWGSAFHLTPFAQRQSRSLGGGVGPPAAPSQTQPAGSAAQHKALKTFSPG